MEEVIAIVATAVLGWGVYKWYGEKKWFKIASEGAEVLSVILKSLKDGKVTKEEVKMIKKEIKDVVDLLKDK